MGEFLLELARKLCLLLGLVTLLKTVFMIGALVIINFVTGEIGMYLEASSIFLIFLIPIFLAAGYFYARQHISNLSSIKGHILLIALCVFASLFGIYVPQFLSIISPLLPIIYLIANLALVVLVLIANLYLF